MNQHKHVRRVAATAALALLTLFAAPLSSAFCLFKPPYSDSMSCTSPTVDVFEYVNENSMRRVLLSDPAEMDTVDRGAAGPGWRRTGLLLRMLPATYNQSYAKQLDDVCRFYAPSVNSHFFTASPAECALLKQPGTGWIYERVAFKSDPPVNGTCPAWSSYPVYRYYNNRAAFGDTTHRYSPDRSLKARLEADGWIDEGIGFCALGTSQVPISTYTLYADRVVASAECEDESRSLGGCIAVNQQAPMPLAIRRQDLYPAFNYLNPSPFCLRTGCSSASSPFGEIFSAYGAFASTNIGEIASHSFVQMSSFQPPLDLYGIYVNSRDLIPGSFPATSVNPLYQFSTQPPADATSKDRRVMPWRDRFALDVEISFYLQVKTLLRRPGGHAIAHPVIELIDTTTRRNVYITIGTVSGEPQADFSARDFGVGKPIVSTLFRSDPAFGVRLAGDTFLCNTDNLTSGCLQDGNSYFRFRLRPIDIANVIARARLLDPGLSANIADYAIDNFSFNNEVSGDAEIGLTLSNYKLEIYMP